MNRDLLYSLGLALAAWPPLFERPMAQVPEPPRVVSQGVHRREATAELEACMDMAIPASAKPAAPGDPERCADAAADFIPEQ